MQQNQAINNTSKRKPKNSISFKLNLNDEQKIAKEHILQNDISILTGSAGSGKTLLGVSIALDLFFNREVDKIVITRPTVSKEKIGFLPGDLYEKLDPWLQPIYHNMYNLYDKVKIDKHIADGDIEIVPMSFMRGRTFTKSAIIADECQNISKDEIWMLLSRLGLGSKMVLCGDEHQIDLTHSIGSSIQRLIEICEKVDGMYHCKLLKNHRHPILDKLCEYYQ